jgi:hypothetical protein
MVNSPPPMKKVVPIANAIAWVATGADNAGCEE